jgi:hypothetical protein
LKPKKLPRRHRSKRNKTRFGIKTLRRFDNASAGKEDEVAVEVIEVAMISTEEPGNHDLHHLGGAAHAEDLTTAARR